MSDIELSEKEVLEMRVYAFSVYNEDREAFCLTMQRLSSWLGIVSGTALVALARSDNPAFSVSFGFAVAALSATNLVFDLPGLAKKHNELRKKSVALGGKIEKCQDEDLAQLRFEFHQLYAECPIIFYAVDAVSTNALQINRNRTEILKIKWYQKLLRNFWRYDVSTFTTWIDVEKKEPLETPSNDS